MGGDGGVETVEEFVGEVEEVGGGDRTTPSVGGTATGETFGEGIEAITAHKSSLNNKMY